MKILPQSLSLEELAMQVAALLEESGLNQNDNRVSSLPDARTARYYSTLGLLDRPRMEGRQARDNKRHVLQLLAIKSLQALSMPLAQIQSKLYGLTDDELEALFMSVANGLAARRASAPVVIKWREIIVEPGLRLMVQEGFDQSDKASLLKKIEAALESLD